MRIAVVLKQVPELTEEVAIAADGKDVDRDSLTYKLNEFDDHALEEALQLKEAGGAEVVAVTLDVLDADQILYGAIAKGVDRAVKVTGDTEDVRTNRAAAALLAPALKEIAPDLVLTGVQAADDLDGQIGVLLAAALGWPHASVITHVEPDSGGRTVRMSQEFSGGTVAHLEADLPVVLGVQAARAMPRYAPITKIRQAMQSGKLGTAAAPAAGDVPAPEVRAFRAPESGGGASMLDGAPAEAAEKLVALLRERGLVQA